MRLFGRKAPFTKRIRIEPPAPQIDRHGVAIATVLKDEELYIAEWVSFHRAVGVRHFCVYDDGSTDRTLSILHELLSGDELTILPWRFGMHEVSNGFPINRQVIAFAHAILNFGSRFRWMAFIDVDEFILPKAGRTIEEALVGAKGFPNISLPWHMFGTSGHEKRPAGLVTRNYVLRAADPMSRMKNVMNFKCIVDPCSISEVSVHHFCTKEFNDSTSNDSGNIYSLNQRKMKQFYSSSYIQLNHYYTKSMEEFMKKIERGGVSPTLWEKRKTRLCTALENIEKAQVEDFSMVEFLDKNDISL